MNLKKLHINRKRYRHVDKKPGRKNGDAGSGRGEAPRLCRNGREGTEDQVINLMVENAVSMVNIF
jgi:hypothetical protein